MYINWKFFKVNIIVVGVGFGFVVFFLYLGEFGFFMCLKVVVFILFLYEIDEEYLKSVLKFYLFILLCGFKIDIIMLFESIDKID